MRKYLYLYNFKQKKKNSLIHYVSIYYLLYKQSSLCDRKIYGVTILYSKPLHPAMFCITLSYLRMTFCCLFMHYPSQQELVGTTPHIKHVNISSGK